MNPQTKVDALGLEPDERPHFGMFIRLYQNLGVIKDEQARVSATATIMIATQRAKGVGVKDAWRDDPMTEGQIRALAALEDRYGQDVSKLIDLHLEKLKKKDSKSFTKGEASDLITEIKEGVGERR